MPLNYRIVSFLLALLLTTTSSCATYRVVRVIGVSDSRSGEVRDYYGVAKNNILVPEFTIDAESNYPGTQGEAWARFLSRKERMDALANQKYEIPNSVLFQTERILVAVVLILVAPVAIPVQHFGHLHTDREGRRSWTRSAQEYFDLSINDLHEYRDTIQDPFVMLTI